MRFTLQLLCAGGAILLSAAAARAAIVTGSSVQNTPVNVALGGVATQSSTGYGAPAGFAIDGNVNGDFGAGSTTHTDDAQGGLQNWQVDLGASHKVDQVVIYPRDGCCQNRLSNYRISVLDASNAEVAGQDFLSQPEGGAQPVNFGGVYGQTVRIQQLGLNNGGNNVLSLAEVSVLHYNSLFTNVAAGKAATQSSTAYGGSAARANDGDISGNWSFETLSHTIDGNFGGPVFWEVDLAGDYAINEISIHNRADCCSDRLGNFRVSIYNDGSEVWGADQAVGDPGSNLNIGALLSVYENTGGIIASGDRVRIELIGGRNNTDPGLGNSTTLSLAEVQVFGVAVPEPGSAGLVFLAGFALLRRRR